MRRARINMVQHSKTIQPLAASSQNWTPKRHSYFNARWCITLLIKMSHDKEKIIPMTAQEEREVHRVFELLSDYQQKVKIKEEIKDINSWITSYKKQGNESQDGNIQSSLQRLEELSKELQALESKPDKKISCGDVMEMLKFLNQKATKKEVEEMIWEVDENLDGYLDWAEFRLMFNRNITDRTGLEPSRMVGINKYILISFANCQCYVVSHF
jgi:hypothetical protein